MTYTLDDLPQTTATPKDYLRLHFDPSRLPEKRIVGLLACQRDPLLRTLRTTVHSASPAAFAVPPPQKGKANKKKVETPAASESPTPVGKLWEVELMDTVIFPEGTQRSVDNDQSLRFSSTGGGQPSDAGKIWILDPNGGRKQSFAIESCLRRKLDSVHLVRVAEDDTAVFEVLAGTEVELELDWDRRQDQMAIHTAQHLLSAVLDKKGLPTLSWGMPAYPSLETAYIELPRGITWLEAEQAEKECNDYIKENRKIWIDVTLQSAEGINADDKVKDSLGIDVERESRGVPKDYTGGVIRFCNIHELDCNACCGTQCPSLSLCGPIHVIPPSTLSTAAAPASLVPTRLFFSAGPRAIPFMQQASRTLSLAAQVVLSGRGDLIPKMEKYELLRAQVFDREKGLRREVIDLMIENAMAQASNKVVLIHRREKATHDFDFLTSIANTFVNQAQTDGQAPVIILISSPADTPPALLQVQSLSNDLAKRASELLKVALDALASDTKSRVKGGGARGRYMSKIDGRFGEAETDAVARVVAELRNEQA
ncbi:hypothetical protein P7C73_g3642, partial [Tremellales sp. Uapishka_1]